MPAVHYFNHSAWHLVRVPRVFNRMRVKEALQLHSQGTTDTETNHRLASCSCNPTAGLVRHWASPTTANRISHYSRPSFSSRLSSSLSHEHAALTSAPVFLPQQCPSPGIHPRNQLKSHLLLEAFLGVTGLRSSLLLSSELPQPLQSVPRSEASASATYAAGFTLIPDAHMRPVLCKQNPV